LRVDGCYRRTASAAHPAVSNISDQIARLGESVRYGNERFDLARVRLKPGRNPLAHRNRQWGRMFGHRTRKLDVRLPGKNNSNFHGARPVHLIIKMIKSIRTSRLSIKNSLSPFGHRDQAALDGVAVERAVRVVRPRRAIHLRSMQISTRRMQPSGCLSG
jgi:hypothetical protein